MLSPGQPFYTARRALFAGLAVLLSLFTLLEVNYPVLTPQSQLAVFALLGIVLVFLKYPLHASLADNVPARLFDGLLIIATGICFIYVLVQTEPFFSSFRPGERSLGNRAGLETPADVLVGLLGLLIVLEATRRAIGRTLPLLALFFVFYAAFGPHLPDWLFPHRGYPWDRIVSQTFLHSQGVFGIALKVMFTYVFLFVLFGTLLEQTGATAFIINFARNLFRRSTGGPAKVAVLSSGMMGSLSGSAVANTATTGTFTIPLMRSAGFKPHIAAGIEAAASSGGALVPPIMGAGAYMMLEIVEPPVTYLEIITAAAIPAILYYVALLLSVHLYAARIGTAAGETIPEPAGDRVHPFQGWLFLAAFAILILFLLIGYTPFRAVTLSLIVILGLSAFSSFTRVSFRRIGEAMVSAAHGGIALVAAASCVGIIIGVVTLTGVGTRLPAMILPLAQNNLIAALLMLMVSTIILGMGLPSAVCYLLMATLVGPVLDDLGVVPLAAHLFIFYFGMMSMVTPPVALAAYTAAAIARSGIMASGLAAFRFALVGFALPFAFVLRPRLLLLAGAPGGIIVSLLLALIGIILLAISIAGYAFREVRLWQRGLVFISALVFILTPTGGSMLIQSAAGLVAGIILAVNYHSGRSSK